MSQFQVRKKLRKACSKARYTILATFGIEQDRDNQGSSKPSIRKASLKTLTLLSIGTPLSLGLVSAANAAVVSNGTIQLGINPQGHIIDSPTQIGINFLPTGNDGISPGCACEGWGIADAVSGVSGYASIDLGGISNINVVDFITDGIRATSVVNVGSTFKVTHDYAPVAETAFLYKAAVTIENIGTKAVGDLRYRRVMDWDIQPTAFSEFSTVKTSGATNVLFTSDNGFANPNPLSGPSQILFTGEAVDSGPTDHGALFDFGFGELAAGASRTFNIFYGAAPNEAQALAALAAVGADRVYSLGQANVPGGASTGEPNTFAFGFAGVGEPPKEEVPEPLTILGSLAAGSIGVALRRKYQQQKDNAKA